MTHLKTRQPRVVIADDHPQVLSAIGRLLEPSCEVVARVANGADAFTAANTLRPDVLVIDLMMPDMNGLELYKRVKREIVHTAVVIISGFDDSEIRRIVLAEGVAAYVPKHRVADVLSETILRIVAQTQRHSGGIE
jgi:DNA-binding NarL/FixJ family response regulator